MNTVTVEVMPRPYKVEIGEGARRDLGAMVKKESPKAQLAVVVTQASLIDLGVLRDIDPGITCEVLTIGEGEDAKSLATIEALSRSFVQMGLSRHDIIIGVGGGLVSDVAGFAAATFHRGVDYLSVSTTLLGQIDAAIGGKTGVNLPEGKNLIGAFSQPVGVIADTELLATLPEREWACGRGEMAKYAFLGRGTPSLEILSLDLDDQVERCVAIKAAVVAVDEREAGARMTLNYGHTLAHALEAIGLAERAQGLATTTSALVHGEAVAIGLVFASELAHRLGRIDQERVALHHQLIEGFGLRGSLPPGLSAEELVATMARDKKAHHDLTFVLDGPNGVEPVSGLDPGVVLATLKEMGANA